MRGLVGPQVISLGNAQILGLPEGAVAATTAGRLVSHHAPIKKLLPPDSASH